MCENHEDKSREVDELLAGGAISLRESWLRRLGIGLLSILFGCLAYYIHWALDQFIDGRIFSTWLFGLLVRFVVDAAAILAAVMFVGAIFATKSVDRFYEHSKAHLEFAVNIFIVLSIFLPLIGGITLVTLSWLGVTK